MDTAYAYELCKNQLKYCLYNKMYDIKGCSKCGIFSLKSTFHQNKDMSDGLDPRCRICWKQSYLDNRDRKKQNYFNN